MYVLLLSQQGLAIVQRPEPALQLGGDKRLARLIQRLQGARLQRKAVQPPGVRVQHVLLGLPGVTVDEIDTVYSHPQALAQCKHYLEEHPSWKTVKAENTAASAKRIKEEQKRNQAAIASRAAGELYGLSILAENICHNDQNVTRFIIVSSKPIYEKNAGKISVCFELPHASGTLYHMLSHFIYNSLSMTKIESRPIPGQNWKYRFFVDFEGNLEDPAVKNALRGLEAEAIGVRVLGNYGQQEEI